MSQVGPFRAAATPPSVNIGTAGNQENKNSTGNKEKR